MTLHSPELAAGPRHSWRSPDLGPRHTVRVPQGSIHYYCRGSGPALVFVHGWLANSNLWRKVVPLLSERFRCIVPDFPFGSHLVALDAHASLSPDGCGELILSFLEALGLSDVTLVGNDSGGAYAQIATAMNSARIGRLVLNSCETPYDEFPPPTFAGLKRAAEKPEQLHRTLAALEDPEVRSSPAAYGSLAKRPIADEVLSSYVLPILRDPGVLRDASKLMQSADASYVRRAAVTLKREFRHPALFVWSPEDQLFPLEHARRYASELPDGRVELVTDAFSFTPEDQPERMATLLAEFLH